MLCPRTFCECTIRYVLCLAPSQADALEEQTHWESGKHARLGALIRLRGIKWEGLKASRLFGQYGPVWLSAI
jgi:hypothetical protein